MGAMAIAPNPATENIATDIDSPSCWGSKCNVCVNMIGSAVECIEAQTPPKTFTISNGHIFDRDAISFERRKSSTNDLCFLIGGLSSLLLLLLDFVSAFLFGRNKSDNIADSKEPITANFAPA